MSSLSTANPVGAPLPRPPSAVLDMWLVRYRDAQTGLWGINASADDRYAALFGRDAVTAATELLRHRRMGWEVARGAILTLAPHQGVIYAPDGPHSNEEEPGKYSHEYRSVFVNHRDGERVNAERRAIFEQSRRRWGGTATETTAYSSVDVTPALVRLIAEYHAHVPGPSRRGGVMVQPPDILDVRFPNRAGEEITLAESVRRAVEWIVTRINASDLGLLEWRSRNPDVFTKFQTWKDSAAFLHTDGEIANWDLPIAAVEVQGLAYDALVGAAELFRTHPRARATLTAVDDWDAPQRWAAMARSLQERTLEMFWMPEERFFAMAIDRDPRTGMHRQVRTQTSSVGTLLNTRIFDLLHHDPERNARLRRWYLEPVISTLYSPAFLTDAGIRCRSIEHGAISPTWDYHGDQVTWAKDVSDCAAGLRSQGFEGAARQLEWRVLNAVNAAGRNLEFMYVDRDTGRIDLRPEVLDDPGDPRSRILGGMVPLKVQAWTAASVLRIKGERGGVVEPRPPGTDTWARRADQALVLREPRAHLLGTRAELAAFRGRQGEFVIDRLAAQVIDLNRRLLHDARLASSPLAEARRLRALRGRPPTTPELVS